MDLQINHWIGDYMCQQLWKEYVNNDTLNLNHFNNRDFLQGLLFLQVPESSQARFETLLLVILCNLVDGESCMLRYEGVEEPQTVLENLITQVSELVLEFGENLEKVEEFIEVARTQAVYVCCREGEFDLAEEVLDRLEVDAQNAKELRLIKRLRSVVSSKDEKHAYLTECPYSDMKVAAVAMLDNKMKQLQEPFLLVAAKKVLAKKNKMLEKKFPESVNAAAIRSLMSNNESTDFHLTRTQEKAARKQVENLKHRKEHYKRLLSERGRSEGTPDEQSENTSIEKNSMREIDNPAPQESISPVKAINSSNEFTHASKSTSSQKQQAPTTQTNHSARSEFLDSSTPNKSTRSRTKETRSRSRTETSKPTRPGTSKSDKQEQNSDSESTDTSVHDIRSHKLRRGEKRKNRHQADTNSSDNSDEDKALKDRLGVSRLRSPARRQSLAPKRPVQPSGHKKRVPWTPEEEADLYKHMIEYGHGSWAKIAACDDMEKRTNVDIKDKWRNMISASNRPRFMKFAAKYGVIRGFDFR